MTLLRRVLGLDLSTSPSKPTGYSIITTSLRLLDYGVLRFEEEFLEKAVKHRVSLVAIDAPLSFSKTSSYRSCEVEMLKYGLRVYPTSISWMRKLAVRGVRVAEIFRRASLRVVETHPSSSLRACGFKGNIRRSSEVKTFIEETWKFKIGKCSRHVLDAIVASIAGAYYLEGKALIFKTRECTIVLACRI